MLVHTSSEPVATAEPDVAFGTIDLAEAVPAAETVPLNGLCKWMESEAEPVAPTEPATYLCMCGPQAAVQEAEDEPCSSLGNLIEHAAEPMAETLPKKYRRLLMCAVDAEHEAWAMA
jgi:hypothetical protein